MLKAVVAIVLIGHGIGHTMGFMPALGWTGRSSYWTGDSWLLTPALGDTSRWLAWPLWLVAISGFAFAGAGLLGLGLPTGLLPEIAIISSVASLVGIALYANSFATPMNVIAAVAVDLLVLASVFLNWPISAGAAGAL